MTQKGEKHMKKGENQNQVLFSSPILKRFFWKAKYFLSEVT